MKIEMTEDGCAAFKSSLCVDVEQVQSFWSPGGVRRVVYCTSSETESSIDPMQPGYFVRNYPLVGGYIVFDEASASLARKFIFAGLVRDNGCIILSPAEAAAWIAEARAAGVYRDDRRRMSEPWVAHFLGSRVPGRVIG